MVYVDPLMNHGWILRGRKMPNSHLIADSITELHAFAAGLGMKREWHQEGPVPHYDLTPKRRAEAVRLGAKELARREFVGVMRRIRGA